MEQLIAKLKDWYGDWLEDCQALDEQFADGRIIAKTYVVITTNSTEIARVFYIGDGVAISIDKKFNRIPIETALGLIGYGKEIAHYQQSTKNLREYCERVAD